MNCMYTERHHFESVVATQPKFYLGLNYNLVCFAAPEVVNYELITPATDMW